MRLRRAPSSLIATVMLSTVLLATGLTACAAAAQPGAATSAARPAAAAATGTALASVPWNRVGPGWILAQYTSARPGGSSAPLELYLISPGGTKYQLARWPNSQTAPYLVAWSPDGQQ